MKMRTLRIVAGVTVAAALHNTTATSSGQPRARLSLQDEVGAADYVGVVRITGASAVAAPDGWPPVHDALAFRFDAIWHQSPFLKPIAASDEFVMYHAERPGSDPPRDRTDDAWLVFLMRVGERQFNVSRAFQISSAPGGIVTRWLWDEGGRPADAELTIALDEAKDRIERAPRQSPQVTYLGMVLCGVLEPPNDWRSDYFRASVAVTAMLPANLDTPEDKLRWIRALTAGGAADEDAGVTGGPRHFFALVHKDAVPGDAQVRLGSGSNKHIVTGRWIDGTFSINSIANDSGEAPVVKAPVRPTP